MLSWTQQNTRQTLLRSGRRRPRLIRPSVRRGAQTGQAAMAAPQGPLVAAVLLLVSSALLCSSSSPACPHSCTCQTTQLLNCSSSGLSSVPQRLPDSVTELDLSHNLLSSVALQQPHHNLRSVWLGNNSITHLSLCVDGNYGAKHLRRRPCLRSRAGQGCEAWAPTLQLLSVERNLLRRLPQGLEGLGSLQVLQLSFNRITSLQPGDLSHLSQLKVLDLQHNHLTNLHPQIFKDLVQLRVINLSFNMLTSLHPVTYLTLRNIGADVELGGNRWQCDCSVRGLKRRMASDSSRGLQAWRMVCAAPSILSGRDLLQLDEDDLNCDTTETSRKLHQDVTVHRGSEILLTCPTPDSVLWTPGAQSPIIQPQAGLLIRDITDKDTGLYVCVSKGQVEMVFNLQIREIGGAKRERRDLSSVSVSEGAMSRVGETKQHSQRDLTLAVCLSVSITFLVAFILGFLAKPCIDSLWKKVTSKRRAKETNSESSAGQTQYENEGFVSGEEAEIIAGTRERRVTFSTVDFIEDHTVQYYDTVANEDQAAMSKDVVVECEVFEAGRRTRRDSESDNSSQRSTLEDGRGVSGDIIVDRGHNVEFGREERQRLSSSSSSSDSSLSKMRLKEEERTQKASKVRNVEVSQISTDGRTEAVDFASEPFSDWSPHTKSTGPNSSAEIEEQFDFSDSGRSASVRSDSVFDSFSGQKQTVVSTSDKRRRDDTSSSSSELSENEITTYTVNYDQDTSLELESHSTDPIRTTAGFHQSDNGYDTKRAAVRHDHSSSDSTDSDEERERPAIKQRTPEEVLRDTTVKVTPLPRQRWRDLSSSVTGQGKSLDTRAHSPPARHSSSSSSSDSEAKTTDPKAEDFKGREFQTKKQLNVSGALSDSSSSSSDESADETEHQMQREELMRVQVQESQRATVNSRERLVAPVVGLKQVPQQENHLDIKASSPATDSSSSSDSEDEVTKQSNKQEEWVHVSRPPIKVPPTVSPRLQTQRPVVEAERMTPVKTRLDIKSPSAASSSSSSSSSDSEDESTGYRNKQTAGKVSVTRLQSQTGSYDQSTGWPAVDLQRVRCRIKRRLDVKPSLPSSDSSSSSSDSEDEATTHIQRQEQWDWSQKSDTQWPVVDLQKTRRIKRRLDINATSLSSDSSSSSDSEDEVIKPIKQQEQGNLYVPRPSARLSQTVIHGPATQQPVVDVVKVTPTKRKAPTPPKRTPPLDIEHMTHIERVPDVKAPSLSSDSSSSSEDETIKPVQKQVEGKSTISRPPIEATYLTQQAVVDVVHVSPVKRKAPAPPPQGSTKQRATLDPVRTTHIEKRLDIKAPLPSADSSSSSDSGEETTGKLVITRLPSQTYSDAGWPLLDLQRVTRLKWRLAIRAPSPSSDSSSSSDSEDEMIHIRKQEQVESQMSKLPVKVSQTHSVHPETGWPSLDLQRTTRVKRRLDIKAASQPSDTSSSSDSEEETTGHVQKKTTESLSITRLPSGSYDPNATWPVLNLQRTSRLKRRLDVKVQTPMSDSSSSSDSEDEIHIKKQEQGELQMPRSPIKVSPTLSFKTGTQWPILDLQKNTRIKRRLDVKAPSPSSDSSSSSDSEDETRGHVQKKTTESLRITRLPSGSYAPNATWPFVNLQRISRLKRRLDVKVQIPLSDSSSSSDSEEETRDHVQRETTESLSITRLPSGSYDPNATWPLLNLQRTSRLKRRLDIKVQTPLSDSSSSSDSEEETRGHVQKKTTESLHITRLPSGSYDPNATWPVLNLQRTSRLKRRLDVKVQTPMSDSSSSSDSEDEIHTKKQEQEELQMSRPPIKVSPTLSFETGTQWPLLDLQRTTHVKRRLDVKAPSPSSDSSSSSDSEDETRGHVQKKTTESLRITRLPSGSYDPNATWPLVNLQRISRLKRRLNVKVQTPLSDSSSSSDSEEETRDHVQRKTTESLSMTRLPSGSYDPNATWPILNLQRISRLKRRLDMKVQMPMSDSSSSSDSEDETHIKKQEQGELQMSRPAVKVSPTLSFKTGAQWPLLDLQRTTHVKRRLDVKAPSPSSDSSSSSDSEDETSHTIKQEKEKLYVTRPSLKLPQTVSVETEAHRSSVDLNHKIGVKRRLNIKAPSPHSDTSTSSSDSEEEIGGYVEKKTTAHLGITRLPSGSYDPNATWPLLDLRRTSRLKRRLDIKVQTPLSDSSSSSDSEEETGGYVQKKTTAHLGISRLPSGSYDPNATWPILNLQRTSRLKRRLDVKIQTPMSDSSSSSDSEEETHIKKQEQGILNISKPPLSVIPTVTRQPVVDPYRTTSIRSHQDIKPPSLSSSSSSSDSEEENTGHSKTQTAVLLGKTRFPSESYEPGAGWPLLNLQFVPRIKRRLDIKAPSPQFKSTSSEDEITGHSTTKLVMTRLPSQRESPGVLAGTGGNTNYTWEVKREETRKVTSSDSSSSSDEQEEGPKQLRQPRLQLKPHSATGWSDPGFNSTLQVKRRLDIKVVPQSPESSSSSDEREDWRTGTTVRVDSDRPKVGITSSQPGTTPSGSTMTATYKPYLSRRLDIRAPLPQPDVGLSGSSLRSHKSESSSSSESEDDRKDGKTRVGAGASFTSTTSEKRFVGSTEGMLIKASGSSKKDDNIRLKTYTSISDFRSEPTADNTGSTQEINTELQSRWATMNLGYSRSRQRPVSTQLRGPLPYSPPPDSPYSSSGDSGSRIRSNRTRQRRVVGMQELNQTDSSLVLTPAPIVSSSNTLKVQEGSREDYSLLTTEATSYRNTSPAGFEMPQVKRPLGITIKGKSPTAAPSHRLSDSSSSSSGEDEVDHIAPNLSHGVPRVKRRLNIKAPSPEPSTSPSSSDSERRLTDNESPITYKRLIMKAPSLPNDLYSSRFTSQTDRNASPAPRRVASVGLDDVVKRRMDRSQLNTDVPPEIRWTGIGYHLPDLSSTTDRRGLSAASASPEPAPSKKPEVPPPRYPTSSSESSSSDSDDDKKQNSAKTGETLTREYTSKSVYSTYETSVDRPQRRGLSALKAMSSERQTWDTKDLDKGASPSVHDPRNDTSWNYRRPGLDINPLSKQAPTQEVLVSASIYDGRTPDLLHPVPSYRRHDLMEPPQEAPPPIPTTPLPDEEVTLAWRPPPSYRSREWEGKTFSQQQSRSTNLTNTSSLTSENLLIDFDSTNISQV